MECSKAELYISKWSDNELDKEGIVEVSLHIQNCISCRNFSKDIFFMGERLAGLPMATPSSRPAKSLISQFINKKEPPGFFTWWRFAGPGIRAAAVSLAAAGILTGFIFASKTINIDSQIPNSPYFMAINSSTGDLY